MKYKESAVVLVFNDANELALQLRAAKDLNYPLHWDFSAAGGIDTGEEPKIGALRELKEELGIESEITFIGEDQFQDTNQLDKLYVYQTTYNGAFHPDPAEVAEARFFSLDQIQEMIEKKSKFHPEFIYIWNKGIIKPLLQ